MSQVKLHSLEDPIMSAWNVTNDLDLLYESILEQDMTKDQVVNVLLGMSEIYNLRFQKLFDTYEQVIRSRV